VARHASDPEADRRQRGLDRAGPEHPPEDSSNGGSDDRDLPAARFASEAERDPIDDSGGGLSAQVEQPRDDQGQRELENSGADPGGGAHEELLHRPDQRLRLIAHPLRIGADGLPPLGR
jgi:hypothetical protein